MIYIANFVSPTTTTYMSEGTGFNGVVLAVPRRRQEIRSELDP